jgi:Zn-dependent membrane protease YugP
LFHFVTLPVEFNASSRALRQLSSGGMLMEQEITGARKVLNAAALTYVAATAVALIHLVRLIVLRGDR